MQRIIATWLFFVGWNFSLCLTYAQETVQADSSLERSIKAKWLDYALRMKAVQGTVATETVTNGKTENTRLEFLRGSSDRFLVIRESGKNWARAFGLNPAYFFQLRSTSINSNWEVSLLEPNSKETASALVSHVEQINQRMPRGALPVIGYRTIAEIGELPECELVPLGEINQDGHIDFKVEYSYQVTINSFRRTEKVAGTLTLDSQKYYLPVAQDIVCESKVYSEKEHLQVGEPSLASIEMNYVYQAVDKIPVIRQCEFKGTFQAGSNTMNMKSHSTFELSPRGAPNPRSAFTLSAFGLPEPDFGRTAGRWKTYLTVAILAIGMIGIGWYVRARYQK